MANLDGGRMTYETYPVPEFVDSYSPIEFDPEKREPWATPATHPHLMPAKPSMWVTLMRFLWGWV